MDFGANEIPIEVIKEGAFAGTYSRDIYSSVNGKWYRKTWKEFDELKNIDPKYYCPNYYDVSVSKYGIKCRTSLRFWENNGWIHSMVDSFYSIHSYGWFRWYFKYWLGRRSEDDERQIKRWKGIVTRFIDKLVEMIKDASTKYDDYSISPKI